MTIAIFDTMRESDVDGNLLITYNIYLFSQFLFRTTKLSTSSSVCNGGSDRMVSHCPKFSMLYFKYKELSTSLNRRKTICYPHEFRVTGFQVRNFLLLFYPSLCKKGFSSYSFLVDR